MTMKIETVHRCGAVAPTWGDEQQVYPSKRIEIALKDVDDNAAILSKEIARAPSLDAAATPVLER